MQEWGKKKAQELQPGDIVSMVLAHGQKRALEVKSADVFTIGQKQKVHVTLYTGIYGAPWGSVTQTFVMSPDTYMPLALSGIKHMDSVDDEREREGFLYLHNEEQNTP